MLKELISKVLSIALVLGALHATAGGINPEKTEDKGTSQTIIKSDSTKKTSDVSSAALETLSEKVSEKTSNATDNDDEVSGSDSSSSIVSFNFVYYLLEKFKFSDLLGR